MLTIQFLKQGHQKYNIMTVLSEFPLTSSWKYSKCYFGCRQQSEKGSHSHSSGFNQEPSPTLSYLSVIITLHVLLLLLVAISITIVNLTSGVNCYSRTHKYKIMFIVTKPISGLQLIRSSDSPQSDAQIHYNVIM